MTDFELAELDLNAQGLNRLGDTISYSINGAPAADVLGFLYLDTDDALTGTVDPGKVRWKLKIDKPFPRPRSTDRVMHSKLGPDVYRPMDTTLSDDGNSYLCDLNKASQ